MKHTIHLLVALVLLLIATRPRDASAAPFAIGTTIFEAVDSVSVHSDRYLLVEGLVQGEAEPRELMFDFPNAVTAERCDRQALLAIDKPGRYLFALTKPDVNSYYFTGCSLKRR